MFAGLLAWQLYGLEPERVCKTPFDFARGEAATYFQAFQTCIGLYAKVLDIKDHAIIGLMTILALGYLMMLMRETRMTGSITLPGGGGMNLTHDKSMEDAAAAGAQAATNSAQQTTDAIAGKVE